MRVDDLAVYDLVGLEVVPVHVYWKALRHGREEDADGVSETV